MSRWCYALLLSSHILDGPRLHYSLLQWMSGKPGAWLDNLITDHRWSWDAHFCYPPSLPCCNSHYDMIEYSKAVFLRRRDPQYLWQSPNTKHNFVLHSENTLPPSIVGPFNKDIRNSGRFGGYFQKPRPNSIQRNHGIIKLNCLCDYNHKSIMRIKPFLHIPVIVLCVAAAAPAAGSQFCSSGWAKKSCFNWPPQSNYAVCYRKS